MLISALPVSVLTASVVVSPSSLPTVVADSVVEAPWISRYCSETLRSCFSFCESSSSPASAFWYSSRCRNAARCSDRTVASRSELPLSPLLKLMLV